MPAATASGHGVDGDMSNKELLSAELNLVSRVETVWSVGVALL